MTTHYRFWKDDGGEPVEGEHDLLVMCGIGPEGHDTCLAYKALDFGDRAECLASLCGLAGLLSVEVRHILREMHEIAPKIPTQDLEEMVNIAIRFLEQKQGPQREAKLEHVREEARKADELDKLRAVIDPYKHLKNPETEE